MRVHWCPRGWAGRDWTDLVDILARWWFQRCVFLTTRIGEMIQFLLQYMFEMFQKWIETTKYLGDGDVWALHTLQWDSCTKRFFSRHDIYLHRGSLLGCPRKLGSKVRISGL